MASTIFAYERVWHIPLYVTLDLLYHLFPFFFYTQFFVSRSTGRCGFVRWFGFSFSGAFALSFELFFIHLCFWTLTFSALKIIFAWEHVLCAKANRCPTQLRVWGPATITFSCRAFDPRAFIFMWLCVHCAHFLSLENLCWFSWTREENPIWSIHLYNIIVIIIIVIIVYYWGSQDTKWPSLLTFY